MKGEAYLQVLIRIAKADGFLDSAEEAFIGDVARRRGIPVPDMGSVLAPGEATLPEDPLERFALLDDMMRLAAVDGHLDEGEHRMISELATKLGFEEGLVSSMLDSLKSSLEAPFVNAYRPGNRPTNFLNG